MIENFQPTGADQSSRAPSRVPRYAIIFRTHFWDAFTQRQYDRLCAQAQAGDVYVLVDETRGRVEGIPGRVFRLTDGQILEAGYPDSGDGPVQWFSGDVPLYMFLNAYPDYQYYLQLEYDVNIHRNVDELITRVAEDDVDMVALTKRETKPDWNWMFSCRGVYPQDEVTHQLICLSIYSNKALVALAKTRLEQAERFRTGAIPKWPFCEAFVAIEASRQGLRRAELSQYGDVDRYDWFPPFLESELPGLQRNVFVHPVLDRDKYVASLLKIDPGPKRMLLPASEFHGRLRRIGMGKYFGVIFSKAFRTTFVKSLRWRLKDRRPA